MSTAIKQILELKDDPEVQAQREFVAETRLEAKMGRMMETFGYEMET